MTALATIFYDPIPVDGISHALLLIPLCLAVSIVYKTSRCNDLKRVPRAAVALTITTVIAMYAIGVGIWVLDYFIS
jgi:hypothetical protein